MDFAALTGVPTAASPPFAALPTGWTKTVWSESPSTGMESSVWTGNLPTVRVQTQDSGLHFSGYQTNRVLVTDEQRLQHADLEMLYKARGDQGSYSSFIARAAANTATYYEARVIGPSNSASRSDGYSIQIARKSTINPLSYDNPHWKVLASGTGPAASCAPSCSYSSPYYLAMWVRFSVSGCDPVRLKLKVWHDGDTEPADWTIMVDDADNSAVIGPGYWGASSFTNHVTLVQSVSWGPVAAPVA
jgi:hypothetical protein